MSGARWNLQMHAYLRLVHPRRALALHFPHVTPVFAYPYPGKNIVSAVCKCLETRHQDIRYQRDLSSWQFRTVRPFTATVFHPRTPRFHPLCPYGSFRHRITPSSWTRSAVSFKRTAAKVAYMINRTFPAGCCLSVCYVETLAEGLNFISFARAADVQEWSLECGLWHRHVSIRA